MENAPGSDFERVEVFAQTLPGRRWTPVVGEETTYLLRQFVQVPPEGRDSLLAEAVDVLARCIPPTTRNETDTGLVIGYVQSGKTMSFTTVTALARDNGYRMVIVITGTSRPLFRQSSGRLRRDLRLAERDERKWKLFENPTPRGTQRENIAQTLADWNDPSIPEPEQQTVLITVMKNHTHLRNLISILQGLELQALPVLVVDDEADQAGMNTQVRNNAESTIYMRLLELRARMPIHTFLQYTATPQAPLLINIIDTLSPRFANLLTPSRDYAGGREFFVETPNLVRTIPFPEIPSATNVLTEPPGSLLEAMRIFFLGVAAGRVQAGSRGNRSMLVHPSQATGGHRQYFTWVQSIRNQWQQVLALPADDPDRVQLIEDFGPAYADLTMTVADLPSFEDLMPRLRQAVGSTLVEEVNARGGQTPQIDWQANYSFILVGGQAMDRGFTVEGLTVTYMPRGAGGGNADTIQQRARFFGHKRRYLGYCRVYLEARVRAAYLAYVEHEEDVRERLLQYRETGEPLFRWKRAFFLDRALRPTRQCVLQLDYMQGTFSDEWYAPATPHDSAEAVQNNRSVVNAFLSALNLSDDNGDPQRTADQRHKVCVDVPLSVAYSELLTKVRTPSPSDSQRYTGLLLQIDAYLEDNPNATCTVYQMGGGRARVRGVDADGELLNLFQGANPDRQSGPLIYPGDRAIRWASGLTIQLHTLNVRGPDRGPVFMENVPAVAVWVPAEMSADWLSQSQGGS